MSPTVVWDVAEGLAIARCQLARFADAKHRVTADHATACQWCPWPNAEIDRLVRGFNAWADRDKNGVYGAYEVRRFRELPVAEQRAEILAAQALTGEPWPPVPLLPDATQTLDRSPADAAEPVDPGPPPPPAWLGGPS